jgi:hypothetical protein
VKEKEDNENSAKVCDDGGYLSFRCDQPPPSAATFDGMYGDVWASRLCNGLENKHVRYLHSIGAAFAAAIVSACSLYARINVVD